ncbi:MAG: hypothetical protein IID38_02960 [Planctomycetes bacterium]|nr:hypothetical protein [Planctomycetota bacterium]
MDVFFEPSYDSLLAFTSERRCEISLLRGIIFARAMLQNHSIESISPLPSRCQQQLAVLHKKSKRVAVAHGRSDLLALGVTDVAWPAFGPNLPP